MKVLILFQFAFFFESLSNIRAYSMVPVISLNHKVNITKKSVKEPLKFLPFIMLIDRDKDTSEYWRETEILSLVRNNDANIDYEKCEMSSPEKALVQIPSRRTVRPICRSTYGKAQTLIKNSRYTQEKPTSQC